MNACKICGSHAINPRQNGRGEDRLDLCDVCYWREMLTELVEALRWERECDEFDLCWRDYLSYNGDEEFEKISRSARAAVDALVGEG